MIKYTSKQILSKKTKKMKKLVLCFAMIVIAVSTASVMAQNGYPYSKSLKYAGNPYFPSNPSCTQEKYPDLYDGDWQGPTVLGADTMAYVTMTIPFSFVTYAGIGAKYYVTHPVPGNECVETVSSVNDTENETIRSMVEMAQKYPKALAKMDISIQMIYVNGKTNGIWKLHSSGRPNDPASL